MYIKSKKPKLLRPCPSKRIMDDPVLLAMEHIVSEYGDQGSFSIDGKEYTTPEMMDHLRSRSLVGLRFKAMVNEIIILYLMKFKGNNKGRR